eukprot:CAMPEP_0178501260 /NCGR_PEP_ID=MMETSP0696-20121128/16845_1 /TAXON_ID=265572 /ORGANISM="Extubocellulus spinifer, Strain CCMP396" /LENGTH=417 /DNA_ID=CAMNT_0020130177 /DNA_START=33 /DNA_END=1286 /DNA_ORIENTATION=+
MATSKNINADEAKAKAIDDLVDIIETKDFLPGAEEHKAGINAERAALGLAPFPPEEKYLNEIQDLPSCDNCNKQESGEFFCSKCKCAFYCSSACQKVAWKVGGHKQACPQYEEQCQALGKQTVADMNDDTRPPVLRMQNLERLDNEGAYKVAVENGLHDTIVKLCKDDTDRALTRFRDGHVYDKTSYAHFVMMTLWRGQRNSRAGSFSYGKCDGTRVKKFIRSSPDAFPALWEACLALVMIPLDEDVYRKDPRLHHEVHQVARDVLAGFSQIFTNDGTSKAILRGPRTKNEETMVAFGKDRIEYFASTINPVIKALDGAKEGRDARSVLEGYIYQNSAMIAYRAREYGIDDDFASKLKMNPASTAMYRTIAVPLGEGTIKKGYALTNEEAQVAMRKAAAELKQEKKSKKKKGKKNRR